MRLLITGAASGIGLACFKYYKSQRVTGIDKSDIDLSHLESVREYVKTIEDYDALIYCAGVREIHAPDQLSLEKWENVLNVNLTANFLISQALIQKALAAERLLSIVNISSVSGFQAEPDRAAYVASKHALNGLTRQLAYQYGRCGIRVNAIAPGIIHTPLTSEYLVDPSRTLKIQEAIPVGRWGDVGHVVSMVDSCLNNNYLNGAILVVDGGWSIGRDL